MYLGSRRLLVEQLCQGSRVVHAHSYPPHIAPRKGHLSEAKYRIVSS